MMCVSLAEKDDDESKGKLKSEMGGEERELYYLFGVIFFFE
jgi:hypothetical protein